jgi:predicted transcriptional regulator
VPPPAAGSGSRRRGRLPEPGSAGLRPAGDDPSRAGKARCGRQGEEKLLGSIGPRPEMRRGEMDMTDEALTAMEMTAGIVSAYLGANRLAPTDLPGFIRQVHGALAGIAGGETATPLAEPLKPAVPIRRSITPDHLISLEDGRPYRLLKRHLAKHGLTPQTYRAKWGLPPDYPMVAATYAAARSTLAKTAGLGRRAATPTPAEATAPKAAARTTAARANPTTAPAGTAKAKAASAEPGVAVDTPPKPRGRPKKPA